MRSDYDESLLLGYVENELSDGERRKVESWMQDDPRLAALLRGMARDRQTLREEPTPDPPDWLLDDVHHGLERSMLLDPKADQAAVVVRQRHIVRKLLGGLAVAAMVLLACGVVFYSVMKINNDPVEWRTPVADANPEAEPPEGREQARDGVAASSGGQASAATESPAAAPSDDATPEPPESLAMAQREAPRALQREVNQAQAAAKGGVEPDADADARILADAVDRPTPATAAGSPAAPETAVEVETGQPTETAAVALAPRDAEPAPFGLAERRDRISTESLTDEAGTGDALETDLLASGRRSEADQAEELPTADFDRAQPPDAQATNFGFVQGGPSGPPMQLRVRTEDLSRSIRHLTEVASRLDRASLTAATVIYAGDGADDEEPTRRGGAAEARMDSTNATRRKAQPLLYRLVVPTEQLTEAIDLLQATTDGFQRVDLEPHSSADRTTGFYRELWPSAEPDYQRILQTQLDRLKTDAPARTEALVIPIVVERQTPVDHDSRSGKPDADGHAAPSPDASQAGGQSTPGPTQTESAEPDRDAAPEPPASEPTP